MADHLGLVGEAAARAPEVGLPLLAQHRAAVELLRIALADAGNHYLDVIDAIRAVLPDPAPTDLDRALALARSGPPAEEVGLEPLRPAEYMGAGLATTVLGNITGHPHDYRLTVAPYSRSIFYFDPHVNLITAAPIGFQIHVILAWVLFAVWPFTRLVHVFSAPLGYLTRPYIVYRSREAAVARPVRRGWEPVTAPVTPRRSTGGRRR